jgi:hypothetical protein
VKLGALRRWVDRPDDEGVTATRETGRRLIASNRRARRDYAILRTYEAGIVLIGYEVKSLRAGHASLAGAFVQEDGGELVLHGLHIPEHVYGRHGTGPLHQPRRSRKLLLHRRAGDADPSGGPLRGTPVQMAKSRPALMNTITAVAKWMPKAVALVPP